MDVQLLTRIEATPGRNDKEALLAGVDASTRRFVRWAVDPYLTFGITVDDDATPIRAPLVDPPWWDVFDQLLGKLSRRELTGAEAANSVIATLNCAPTEAEQAWARRILNKDLRVGVHVKSVVKVLPGLVEPFACQLAHPFDPEKHVLDGVWFVEPKLDGLRCLIIDGKAVTRTGREITSIGHVLDLLADVTDVPAAWVLDAEIMGADGTEFNEASGQVRQKDGTVDSLVLNVFDCVERGEWARRETKPFAERRLDLVRVLSAVVREDGSGPVRAVPQMVLPTDPSAEHLFLARDQFLARGYEGAMVKRASAPYRFKRSSDLLKVKTFLDADGVVVDTFEGRGKFKGMLGGLRVEFEVEVAALPTEHPDDVEDLSCVEVEDTAVKRTVRVVTEVGSGFTNAQRQRPREEWVGKVVEVKYQNMTPDGCLRFPVFIRERPDKREGSP